MAGVCTKGSEAESLRDKAISHQPLPSLATHSLRLVWSQNVCPLSQCLIPNPPAAPYEGHRERPSIQLGPHQSYNLFLPES